MDDDGDGRRDEGCPIRVTTGLEDDRYPSLDGAQVAWVKTSQAWGNGRGEIWLQTLPDGEARQVADGQLPSLSGDRLAYLSEDARLHLLTLSTGQDELIDTPEASFVQRPMLRGDLLAWSHLLRGTDEDYEVVVLDLRDRSRRVLGAHPTIQEFPVVERDGTRVAYSDDRSGHHIVFLEHFFEAYVAEGASYTPRLVRARAADELHGGVVAFEGGALLMQLSWGPLDGVPRTRECAAALIEVADGSLRLLGERMEGCPVARARSGARVIFEVDPEGEADLALLDLESNERLAVTHHSRISTQPRIDGDLLVWSDDRNDHFDLYMMDLTDLEAGDFSPEGITP